MWVCTVCCYKEFTCGRVGHNIASVEGWKV